MATIEQMHERIQELEARLAKDSRNSSRPPSSDSPFRKPPPRSRRQPRGRKPGGQPGRRGVTRSLVDDPDQCVIIPLTGTCAGGRTEIATTVLAERRQVPERRHFSRNPKWGPSDFGCKKSGDGHGLRRPTFVLRPSRRTLRAAPGLPQGLDAVSHGLAFRLRRRSRAALRRNARSYGYTGVVALRSSLTLPRFPVFLL